MKKRILIDATNVNITLPGGGSFCTQAYIEAFLRLFPDRVDVLHPAEAHIRDSRYTTIDVPKRDKTQQFRGIFHGQFHRAGQFIVDYLRTNSEYEMVVISTGFFAGGIIPQIASLDIKTVIIHHNFEPEYKLDSRSPLTLYGATDRWIRYWEKKGYLLSDINLFLTQQDKLRFESEYGKREDNYVSGVFEPTSEHQSLLIFSLSQSAVITCALSDKQNVNPLIRFRETYLPIFRQELPDWTIHIMGRNPGPEIIAMNNHEGVEVIPNPENIRSLAAESAIYLCPMDAGGGLKLRIMDGLRAGQPVLAHARAARGYDCFEGKPFFLTYDDEDSFREGLRAINRYIQSFDYSREAVQSQYYRYFSLESGIERLEAILCK